MIGYALSGSFCTLKKSMQILRELVERGEEVVPFMSDSVYNTDTRFFRADDLKREVRHLTGREIIHTIAEAEPFGPNPLDYLIISPCTGNTVAKIANGITDTAVTMIAKAQMRRDGKILVALASNDALSRNLKNIGVLLSMRSFYFLPLRQDDIENKPYSLVADFSQFFTAYEKMKKGDRLRPLFI